MYAVEFDAKINEGIIKIPDRYVPRLGNSVKVIILVGEKDNITVSEFDCIKVNTKGFKFSREDANER
jgi:hypothetical protein